MRADRDRARARSRRGRERQLHRGAAARRRPLAGRARGDDLLDKTEGNPLFVEETVRMLLGAGGD